MDAPATLVWIAPDPPDADQRTAVAGWARSRGATLVDPAPWHPTLLPVDAQVSAEVEDLLDRARDAIAADVAADVDAILDKADALLRAHPELPQAAWLMAEVERDRAVRLLRLRPTDPAAAARAWKRADAIDGGRLPAMGEQGLEGRAEEASVEVVAPLDSQEQAWIDGRRAGAHLTTRAGLHAAVVTWGGDPVWAEWRETPAGASTLALDPPRAAPCSGPDVEGARMDGDHVDAARVQCPSWVLVRPHPGTSRAVEVAECAANRCSASVTWRLPEPWVAPPPVAAAPTKRWPAWAIWSVAGAGAAVATGTAVVLANALRVPPPETRFVTGGIKVSE